MQVYSNYTALPASARNAVVALGNFDGVHRGHVALLAEARTAAYAQGLPLAVLTFHPHPRSFLRSAEAQFQLTTLATKIRLLAEQGVDILYVLDFDEPLSRMSATDFQDRILRDGLKARAVAAGENFRFGHRREGTLAGLAQRDPALQVITPAIVTDASGGQISSTRVRKALENGEPGRAATLLGRPWEIEYVVETGNRRGRELGYPTANGRLGELIRPAYGVYAVRARLEDGRAFQAAANIGIRPMWRTDEPLAETYLFDFDEDIYGKTLRIALVEYLRPEGNFPDIETLKNQMSSDCRQARAILTR